MAITKKELKDCERRIGENYGWSPLGVFLVTIEKKLLPDEKQALGKEMADLVGQIEKLEDEKRAFDKAMKERIDQLDDKLKAVAFDHRSGVRREDVEVPAFYDARSQERHYVEPSTGEILKSCPAEKGDEQMRMVS